MTAFADGAHSYVVGRMSKNALSLSLFLSEVSQKKKEEYIFGAREKGSESEAQRHEGEGRGVDTTQQESVEGSKDPL